MKSSPITFVCIICTGEINIFILCGGIYKTVMYKILSDNIGDNKI